MTDAEQEYKDHAAYCLVANDIHLPDWDQLDDYDKAEWERWSQAKELEKESINGTPI
jgi:hypothetical protein